MKSSEIYPRLTKIRKYLHQHPELSGQEHLTSAYIKNLLERLELFNEIKILGNTGLIAIYDTNNEGPSVLFRSELDALPIQEVNEFDYKSNRIGISHKCGHDGHMTILYGLAERIKSNPIQKGKLYFLFQPAEETGEGARQMLETAFFKNASIDYVFALHNLPGFKQGMVVLKENIFNASVKSLVIRLQGKTAHASQPENGVNPALAIADLLHEFNNQNQLNTSKEDFKLITPIHINLGDKAYGVSAGHGELHLTIRCWGEEQMQILTKEIEAKVLKITSQYKLSYSLESLQNFASNMNDAEAVEYVRSACKSLALEVHSPKVPFKWGEDFGLITAQFKGCMFGLGAGENMPSLHNPDYDFPDELTPIGINIFHQIIQEIFR